MRRYFVVAVHKLTSEETNDINNIFRGGVGWWHWIDGFWLVTDSTDTLSAAKIRDDVGKVVGQKRRLVLEVKPESWAGFGPSSEDSDMFKWLDETWDS